MRFLTKIVCRHADAITVRDADSAEELQRLGIPPEKVQVTADCVLTLEPADKKAGRRILEKAGLDPENRSSAFPCAPGRTTCTACSSSPRRQPP